MKKNTSWGNVAKWYDDLLEEGNDSFQENVILPNILRLVGPKKGMSVLDLACGQGYFTRAFHERGAKTVGVDISPELIALAEKHSPKEIRYARSDITTLARSDLAARADLAALAGASSFDAVTIILALQNMADPDAAIARAADLLSSTGKLIIVLNHPAFRIPRRSGWGWDEERGRQYRRLDAYMSDDRIEVDMHPGKKTKNKGDFTVSFHRPLQSYFKILGKNGLIVSRLEEWISHKVSETGPRSAEEDRMRKEIPMFLCLVAVRGREVGPRNTI